MLCRLLSNSCHMIIFVGCWGVTKVLSVVHLQVSVPKYPHTKLLTCSQYLWPSCQLCLRSQSTHHILVRLQDRCTKLDWLEFLSQDWFSECSQIVTSSISSQSNIADSYHQHYFSQSHTAVYVSVLCIVLQLTVFTSTACCVLFVRLTVWCSTYKCTIVHLLTH